MTERDWQSVSEEGASFEMSEPDWQSVSEEGARSGRHPPRHRLPAVLSKLRLRWPLKSHARRARSPQASGLHRELRGAVVSLDIPASELRGLGQVGVRGQAELGEKQKPQEQPEKEHADLLDLAYEAAVSRLASQTSALEGLRTRASGLFLVAALVTSFSAGLGLVNTDPGKGSVLPGWAPWVLLGILLVLGFCAFSILMPTPHWVHGPSAGEILKVRQVGPYTEGKLFVVQAMVAAQTGNSAQLARRALAYRTAVLLLLAEVLVLVAAVAQTRAA